MLESKSCTGTRQTKDIHNFDWQFPLFVFSQCDFCSPAWQFCTTWMARCKWPISPLFIPWERRPKRFSALTKDQWRALDPPLSTWYRATLKHFLRLHWCKLVFDDRVCDSPDFSLWWCSIRGGFISNVPRKKRTRQMNGMLRRFNL